MWKRAHVNAGNMNFILSPSGTHKGSKQTKKERNEDKKMNLLRINEAFLPFYFHDSDSRIHSFTLIQIEELDPVKEEKKKST